METKRYVQEVMTAPVIAVKPDISSDEAARLLAQRRIGAVPVVDQSLHVLGIIAESDLLSDVSPPSGTAREAMTSPAVTVTAGTTLGEARAVLLGRDIGRLPVVDGDGVLVGIVSRRDLLQSQVPADDELRRRILDRAIDAGAEVYDVTVSDGSVSVRGRVALRSEVTVLEQMLEQTPGVVRFELDFSYAFDDVEPETTDEQPGGK